MAKRKKNELHRELGQKVWDERLDVHGAEKISTTLAKLMESKASLLNELVETEIKASKLKKRFDKKIVMGEIKISGKKTDLKIFNERFTSAKNRTKATRSLAVQKKKDAEKVTKNIHLLEKEHLNLEKTSPLDEEKQKLKDRITKQIEEAKDARKDIDVSIVELREQLILYEEEEKSLNEKSQEQSKLNKIFEEENKKEMDELKKEINEWERNKIRVQEKIERIEKRTVPLFENLGILAEYTRIEHKALLLNYSQIDRNKRRISDIEQQFKDLE